MSGIIASSWTPVHPWYPQPTLGEPVPSGYIGIEAIDPPSGHYHIGLRHQFGNIPSGWAPGAGPCGSMRVYLPLPPSGYLPWRQSNGDVQLRPNNWPPLINSGAICCGAMITTPPQPLYPPDIGPWTASGAYTFPVCGNIGSGTLHSGAFSSVQDPRRCAVCGKGMGYFNSGAYVHLIGNFPPYDDGYYHIGCTPWRRELDRFETREDWLREDAPFVSGTPCWMLADWLEEQGRYKDATWLRRERSGR